MKPILCIALAIFCATCGAFAEPSETEIVALMNRVQSRVAGGDVKALDELASLPPKWATAAYLTIFKDYRVKDATPAMDLVCKRCAQLATSTPAGEEYIVKLLKGKPADNYVYFQQVAAIRCLVLVHNETSVRVLGGALEDVDPEEIGAKVTNALADLKLPQAPFPPNQRVRDAEALAKWKLWWAANKGKYSGNSPLP